MNLQPTSFAALDFHTIRTVLRPAPDLSPDDSIERFLQMARGVGVSVLPVLEGDRLHGMAAVSDALPILLAETDGERERMLRRPVRDIVRPAKAVIAPHMTPAEAGGLCARSGQTMLPVADEDGYCHGVVLAADLMLPDFPKPKPAMIGGMATPFGVYLTDGTHQAGVGNLALVASGAIMGIGFGAAFLIVDNTVRWLGRQGILPADLLHRVDFTFSGTTPAVALASLGLQLAVFGMLMLMMRVSSLAGFHAAEHQTVHAVERNEMLVPEVVARMPRVHPRCGTNLMAAMTIFTATWQLVSSVAFLDGFAPVAAILITLTTWRPVGAWLQDKFTTKRASERQLRSGIAAADELLHKYWSAPPARPRPLRRLWVMGMVQTVIGVTLTNILLQWVLDAWH